MSILDAARNRNGIKLIFLKIMNKGFLYWQIIRRSLINTNQKIYFPYFDLINSHPSFLIFYKIPPLNYSTFNKAKNFHYINSIPESHLNKNFIIEPNDHPLSVSKRSEPYEVINFIGAAASIYQSELCKKIIVTGERQVALFQRYLPNLEQKISIIRGISVAKEIDLLKKYTNLGNLTFLCMASDYRKKAVDIVIAAWKDSNAKKHSTLIIACPNIPYEIAQSLGDHNIHLISDAPISQTLKHRLYSNAHVVIAPVHTDGGANISEAFEYGIPVITMRSYRDCILRENGWEIDVPLNFYDEGYGIEWKTWGDYWELLHSLKIHGKFNPVIEKFVSLFDSITIDPSILYEMSINSHFLAKNDFSITKRNLALREIYSNFV